MIKSLTFETSVVLSTLNPDSDSQSETTTVRPRERTNTRRGASAKQGSKKAEASKRGAKSKSKNYKPSQNMVSSTSMDITSVGTSTSRNNSYRQEAMAVDSNEDDLPGGANGSVATHGATRNNSLLSRKSGNGLASKNSTPRGTSSNRSSPAQGSKSSVTKAVFSTILNKQSRSPDTATTVTVTEDIVPNSPPKKPNERARIIFNKCFQTTFDPRMLPGHDVVLAEDTDESD